MKKFLLFCFMFFAFCFKVYASRLELYRIPNVYSSQLNMDTNQYSSYRQNRYVMDGKTVYCVEPGVDINTRDYSLYDLSYSDFSDDILEKISLIGYYGYDYPGHSTDRYFLATQELIWELVGNNEAHFNTGINDSGDYINIDYEKSEVMSLVNSYFLKPAFDGGSYDVVLGEKIVLNDLNHALSNYEVVSDNAYIDGDTLVVNVKELGNKDILLSRKKYDDLSSIYYYASNSQDFMFLRAPDVVSSVSVNGYIPYSYVSLYKTGEVLVDYDEEFIYEERGLDGVSFELFSSENIYVNDELIYSKDDLVDQLITSNGYASSINIPNGKYYLKELGTYSDLIISDDIYFEINNDSPLVFKYDINLKNDRKNVFVSIDKLGEVFDDLDNSHYEGLDDVSFGLYSHDDIYSYDDRLLVSKDSLIDTFVTVDGKVDVKVDLPISSYYFKELEAPIEYVVDDRIINVSFSENDFISYSISSINYLKRGDLCVNKYNVFGEKLDGAHFSLYKGDELIYEGVTSSGFITINNLPYGRYKLFEVNAPEGYIKNNEIYDILIDKSIVSIDVYNEKLPDTSDIYYYKKMFSFFSIVFGLLGGLYDKRIKSS